jgi:hypothetical protein
MSKIELTRDQWLGFSMYLGMKSSHRRDVMKSHGIDYEDTVRALTRVGVLKNGRMDREEAYAIFREKFPNQLASQTHQVLARLQAGE